MKTYEIKAEWNQESKLFIASLPLVEGLEGYKVHSEFGLMLAKCNLVEAIGAHPDTAFAIEVLCGMMKDNTDNLYVQEEIIMALDGFWQDEINDPLIQTTLEQIKSPIYDNLICDIAEDMLQDLEFSNE